MSNPNGKRSFNPTISNANKRLHRTTIGGVPVQHNNEPPEFDSFGQQRLLAQPPPRLSQLQQQQQMQQQEPQHYSAASSSSTSRATQPPARYARSLFVYTFFILFFLCDTKIQFCTMG